MAAYFNCEVMAQFAAKNDDIVLFEIPTRKSNKDKYFPGIHKWSYGRFKKETTRVYDNGISCFKINLEKIIRK